MSDHDLNLYGLLFIVGILLTAWLWGRMTRRECGGTDARLTTIYFAGLVGALIGAKIAFLVAEGWHFRDDWVALVTGRSVTGALLGGYGAVEIAKWKLGYRRATGDLFAVLVPLSLALGRVGCLIEGCCAGIECEDGWWTTHDAQGISRWPSQTVELAFNGVFLAWVMAAARWNWLPGNRFHVYLIAYGLFRFGHEFLREHIDWLGPIGGYHVIALAMAVFGAWRLGGRLRSSESSGSIPSVSAACRS